MAESYSKAQPKMDAQLPPWWLVLLEGLAALIIGIYLIISPVATTILLVQILGIYWLIVGILTLVHLISDRTDMIWKLISGILGVVVGIIILAYPYMSAAIVPATFIILIGVLAICYGFISLFWALKTGWAAAIMGILSIIFGLLLLGSPYIGVVMLIYFLAGLGIVGGIATMYFAFKLRTA
ncbi:MAG: HdeD family acid-resistance protein [Methanotrichaceae archaeon]|nr:HdeD family acid-resistance protein [Methanotrichaceae archaeon]